MAVYLKQSTAINIRMGPFVDSGDGVTAETGLTIAQADVRLSKAQAAFAQKGDTSSATHLENGWYSVPLNSTDTNTLGELIVAVNESGALPVWREFMVVTANVFDSLFSTDLLDVSLVQVAGSTTNVSTLATNVDAILTDTADMQPKLGTPSNLGGGATIAANLSDIEAQTDDIGTAGAGLTAIPWNAAWDTEVQSEAADALTAYDPPTKTEMDSAFAALNDISPAEVNAEVLDVLTTDTFAQPGQEAPAATTSLHTMIRYLYKAWRNRHTATDTEYALYADDGTTKDQEAAISDDGTTFERGEIGTGA